ncbi:MAG: hypothetical protein LBP92_14430 [Deltaproteobacteria bacterium]|jgi:hypothetical protein|nr:hypothetical protein [Deltaproteobacteria bacterium]
MESEDRTDGYPSANDLAMRAVRLFKEGLDCETAVVTVFDELLGLGLVDGLEPRIRRIGLGFQVPCGAILGARRVLARTLDGDPDLARLGQDLDRAFVKKYKATTCQYLTAHIKWGEHHVHCGKYVYAAVENLCAVMEERLDGKILEALGQAEAPQTRH